MLTTPVDESTHTVHARHRVPNVLLADDDDAIIDSIREFLEPHHSLIVAKDGKEAMEVFESDQPDLAIVDIEMPPPDGIEICRVIKSNPKTHLIPVVIISGNGGKKHRITLWEHGADAYFSKPFDLWEFQARVKGLLKTRRRIEHHHQTMPKNSATDHTVEPVRGKKAGPRILVASEDPPLRHILTRFFEARGCAVTAVPDGHEAVDSLRSSRFAAAVLDMYMPRLGGLEALRSIRKLDPDVPVLMLTGLRERLIGQRAMEMGASGYLTKPLHIHNLEQHVVVRHLVAEAA